ncbi:MAG: tryptophan--tRNA ligase [Candidatus Aenigmatarchaeota archaeon]|nr:tryptophan--tRNA ligase [Candidatus Aenigmarchaeota archaeon]
MAKITVDSVEGEINYEQTMQEFGIERIDPYLKQLKNLDTLYRRGIVFGHRDFGLIVDAIKNKKPFAVLTGFNPSGPLHLGNLMVLREALFFQKNGADVFIPISNDETYVFKKAETIEKATKNAYDFVIPDIIALGFDPKKTKIFISTKLAKLYELAIKISTKTTFSAIKAIFGFTNETNPGQIFYAVMQSAHILFPQLDEYGGRKPTVTNIGIDQDPYMRLVRDIAAKLNFVKPASTYHKFMPGLLGGKMSGSKPETCIYLTDEPEVAEKKIMGAFSGGAKTLEEHKKFGGNPEIDVACNYLYFMFEEDDRKIKQIFSDFRNGKLTSGEVKHYLSEKVKRFLTHHQRERERAKNQIENFLLKD